MKITFNSVEKDIPADSTVAGLKEFLSLPETGLAVAVNGKIVTLSASASFMLHEGDDVVAITAAYGG